MLDEQISKLDDSTVKKIKIALIVVGVVAGVAVTAFALNKAGVFSTELVEEVAEITTL